MNQNSRCVNQNSRCVNKHLTCFDRHIEGFVGLAVTQMRFPHHPHHGCDRFNRTSVGRAGRCPFLPTVEPRNPPPRNSKPDSTRAPPEHSNSDSCCACSLWPSSRASASPGAAHRRNDGKNADSIRKLIAGYITAGRAPSPTAPTAKTSGNPGADLSTTSPSCRVRLTLTNSRTNPDGSDRRGSRSGCFTVPRKGLSIQ